MPAVKDEKYNTWTARFYYTDWQGNRKQKKKRGFKTRREANEYEHDFLVKQAHTLDLTFGEFLTIYEDDVKPKLRRNTWLTKQQILREKILPYFENKKMNEITGADIVQWQNMLTGMKDENGNPKYSHGYLKTVQAHLSAVMNHAVKLYELPRNPVLQAGAIGGDDRTKEPEIWTQTEYRKFAEAVEDNPRAFFAFETLYWTGLRVGELLALTPDDIDFQNDILRVNKSLQHIEGEVVITPPKTKAGVRSVIIPHFLTEELDAFIKMQYGLKENDRIFDIDKSTLHKEILRGAKAAGVHPIRVHDIRHSHISMLIDMGFSPVDVAKRVGHEKIDITLHYAHSNPARQHEMADRLRDTREGAQDNDKRQKA